MNNNREAIHFTAETDLGAWVPVNGTRVPENLMAYVDIINDSPYIPARILQYIPNGHTNGNSHCTEAPKPTKKEGFPNSASTTLPGSEAPLATPEPSPVIEVVLFAPKKPNRVTRGVGRYSLRNAARVHQSVRL